MSIYFIGSLSVHRLKVQQGLLVDFSLFPTKLIDLLEQCIAEAVSESPRWEQKYGVTRSSYKIYRQEGETLHVLNYTHL